MFYVLRRKQDAKFAARRSSAHSYTANILNARLFKSYSVISSEELFRLED